MNLVGFHGTDSERAKEILQTQFSIRAQPGWLGTGVYLFERDYKLALRFAGKKFRKVSVIECILEISENEVFDVTDPFSENNALFERTRLALLRTELQRRGYVAKVYSEDQFDSVTYNIICGNQGYKLVRAFTYTYYEEDKQVGQYSKVPNGVELCLRDPAYIKSKRIV